MIYSFKITGMTCNSCEAKVKTALLSIDEVQYAEISKEHDSANIQMERPVLVADLQKVLDNKYRISELSRKEEVTTQKSWFITYKPVLLIFIYIFSVSSLVELISGEMDVYRWMRHFMAGFFLTFSFFKILNLEGFKNSYRMYDIIARRFPGWGYIYAFAELTLGIAFLVNFNPIVTNSATFLIMSVSIIGVLRTVLDRKSIQCACLGDVFKLPMSTVTIIEDGLMIIMSLIKLFMTS